MLLSTCAFLFHRNAHTHFTFFFYFWFQLPRKWSVYTWNAHKTGFHGDAGRRKGLMNEWMRWMERGSYKMMMSNCQLFTTFSEPISNRFGRFVWSSLPFSNFLWFFSRLFFEYRCSLSLTQFDFTITFANEQKKTGERFDHFICGRMSQLMLMIVNFWYSFIGFWAFQQKKFA